MKAFVLVLVFASTIGCASDASGSRRDPPSGLATVFDSTRDTIVATVSGDVPATSVRRLTAELRIAPAEDDTTLFAEVFEFDVDRQGRMWVFDQSTRSIFLFRADGSLERRIGRRGSGPGEFQQNSGMVILPDGRLAVWDSQNARIEFFKPNGDFDRVWVHSSGFNTGNGLRVDTAGTLYVTRPVAEPTAEDSFWRLGLVRLGAEGVWEDSLVPPLMGVVRSNYIAEQRTTGGSNRSSTNVSFAPGAMWSWHPHGFFVSGNGARFHLHYGRVDARPIRVERALPPVPATADERANEEEMIISNMRQTDPAWTWRGEPVPESKAPLTSLFVARDGRVWARVAVPSELIPEDERAVPRAPNAPVRRWRTPPVWEVYSPIGEFLGRIALPPKTSLVEADGDLVWGIQRDSLDLPGVVRFRITPGIDRE